MNDEFDVAPVYNEMVERGMCLAVHDVGDVDDTMHGLGTPKDLGASTATVKAGRLQP